MDVTSNRVAQLLCDAAQNGRLGHAYLLTSNVSDAALDVAMAVARTANCADQQAFGCGQCSACVRINDSNYPDVIELKPQGAAGKIPIAEIRQRLLPQLAMSPHEGRSRFVLVAEATNLLDPAANALLKTLEEPPSSTHFILGTRHPDRLLPTIKSRCMRFTLLFPDTSETTSEEAASLIDWLQAIEKVSHSEIASKLTKTKERTIWSEALQHWARSVRNKVHASLEQDQPASSLAAERRELAALVEAISRLETTNANLSVTLESTILDIRHGRRKRA